MHADAWDLDSRLEMAMDALRCPPADTPIKNAFAAAKSAAWRCADCCCKSRISCLLDEPTNHLDAESVGWLEQHLQKYEGTIIAVTHDRYFLDNVAGWILELDRGEGIPWKGNYSSWLEQKQQRLAQEAKDRRQAAKDARTRTRMDTDVAQGPPCQIEGPHQRLRKDGRDRIGEA
jgi:energy-dependent translational throttle protein EttA